MNKKFLSVVVFGALLASLQVHLRLVKTMTTTSMQ